MRLTDLDGRFIGRYSAGTFRQLDSIDGAQGVSFQCPLCAHGRQKGQEGGRRFFVGVHYVICWFKNPKGAEKVPDDVKPGPGRWNVEGTSLDDLTFVGPGAVSILLTSGCEWHGYLKDGDAS